MLVGIEIGAINGIKHWVTNLRDEVVNLGSQLITITIDGRTLMLWQSRNINVIKQNRSGQISGVRIENYSRFLSIISIISFITIIIMELIRFYEHDLCGVQDTLFKLLKSRLIQHTFLLRSLVKWFLNINFVMRPNYLISNEAGQLLYRLI